MSTRKERSAHTQPTITFILVPFFVLLPAAAEANYDDVKVAEDDHGWWEDGPVVESHDQLIPLEFPDLVGDGFHFKESVAARDTMPSFRQVTAALSTRKLGFV